MSLTETRLDKIIGIGSGTGSRPTAGQSGARWIDTSTTPATESYDDGAAWHDLLSGGLVLLQDTMVGGGGAASVHFASIPATFKHLKLIYRAQLSAGQADLRWVINSDTGTNYSTLLSSMSTTAYAGGSDVGHAYMAMGVGDAATSHWFAAGDVEIPDYTGTDNFKSFNGRAQTHTGTSAATNSVYLEAGLWFNGTPAAITDIVISPPSGTFSQFSRFTLYGYN